MYYCKLINLLTLIESRNINKINLINPDTQGTKNYSNLLINGILRTRVGKTKIDRIRSQHIRYSGGIQTINEWVERRRDWDEHVTRINAQRLVKFSRANIPARRWSPGHPNRRWSDLIRD